MPPTVLFWMIESITSRNVRAAFSASMPTFEKFSMTQFCTRTVPALMMLMPFVPGLVPGWCR